MTGGARRRTGVAMRQSLTAIPLVFLATLCATTPARAVNQQGDVGIATNIGFAYPRTTNTYGSDQTLNFSFEYQRAPAVCGTSARLLD